MSLAPAHDRLQLPETLRAQLLDFRRRVWTIKMIEAVAAAVFGLVAAFLVMFVVDRVWETPGGVRAALFVGGLDRPGACARWPCTAGSGGTAGSTNWPGCSAGSIRSIGDQLLGIIELVRSDAEQARSRALCEAAIEQVAEDAQQRDFRDAVPNPRHRLWGWLVGVPLAASLALLALCPGRGHQCLGAAARALEQHAPLHVRRARAAARARWSSPTASRSPSRPGSRDETAWRPQRGRGPAGRAASRRRAAARRPLRVRAAGADRPRLARGPHRRLGPARPDRADAAARADVGRRRRRAARLPGPQRSRRRRTCAAGPSRWSRGATASFTATASRDLLGGPGRRPAESSRKVPAVTSPATRIDGVRTMEFRWQDAFGLAGKEPFLLAINGRDDEAPSLACEDLPRQKVVLDTEPLNFKVKAQDDFGVKRVGMEWQGVESAVVKTPAKGETHARRRRPRQGNAGRRPAPSRPSRWGSSPSRSTCGSSPRTTSRAASGSTRPPTCSTCSTPSSTRSG